MGMSEAYRQGLKEIALIDPESGKAFVEELKRVSPDFSDYFVEFAFGTIHSRSVLEPKIKELIAVANLTVLGQGQSHLKLSILAAIRVGCSKEEILEVIIQTVIYAGFMRAIIALNLVKEAYEEGGSPFSDPTKSA
jgi:4-carboxymuconolactone decarboxylase